MRILHEFQRLADEAGETERIQRNAAVALGNVCNGDDAQSTLLDADSLVREHAACALTRMLDQVP